jgi:signal transduction histidine kinase/ligand-binding sensor domain-containing protein
MLAVSLLFSVSVGARCESSPYALPIAFNYARTVWRISDGLPEDTVQALAESSQGLLWIGTTGGLAQFDGSRIQLFENPRGQVSSVNSIFCLTMTRDGNLWAGTEGGGLLRIQGKSVQVYANAEGLSDGFVRSIFEDHRGRLWVGTDGGLFFKRGNRFERWHTLVDDAPLAVHSITEDSEQRLWIGGSRLLTIDAAGRNQEYVLPGAYGTNRVKRILQTSDGTVWVGTVGGLQRLRNGRFENVPGIPYTVRTLLQTRDGMLWIGTIGGGLWTAKIGVDGNTALTRIRRPSLLPSETVLSILEDDQNQIWVGTQAGIVRLRQTPVKLISLPEGGDPDFETISGDVRGAVWVAAQRLYGIKDGVASPFSDGVHSPFSVRNIFRARDGALWIGTDGGGAYRVRDGTTTHFTAPSQLTNNFVRAFLETRNGTLWIACDEGVTLVETARIRKLTQSDGLAYLSTRSLLEDRDGSVWVGTDRGLSHWGNGRFLQDEATHALAQEKVWSILQDRHGTLWFGTRDHGLFRYRDGVVQRFTTADGLPTNSIYQLLQDRRGTFWLTGPNTIASIHEPDLEASAPASGQPLSITVYIMPFGAENAQLYGGRQPAGYLAPDDTVWFPTNRGAAHISAEEPFHARPPVAVLDALLEDGKSVALTKDMIVVPSRVSRISFLFSALFLRSQEGVRFRYRLENFDKTWNLSAGSHEATYTNLPAGQYRFRVLAFDAAHPREVSEALLIVAKQPVFYQTWWFYTACLLLLAGLGWASYQVRLRQMRTRFAAVLQERSRLAREMHDTVIQGCTGISALLEAVATTPEKDTAVRDELLDLAREQARSTVSEARQVVWDMRHEQEGDVDLVTALQSLVTQSQRESAVAVAFITDLNYLRVKASMAHEVLMTAREALLNAIQHSGSPNIAIQLQSLGTEVSLSVIDYGEGFSPASSFVAEEGHYGILGMRERTERIGAQFHLSSSPKQGTRVEVVVGLAKLSRSVPRS